MSEPARVPFFIVGCVRSGTTLLRNVLRAHPNLASPEETHFFRWPSPFGTADYLRPYTRNVLKKHRTLDGINDEEFQEIMAESRSRKELMERYMALFIAHRKPTATRWFDKTPQNVYGMALLWDAFPQSKFIHIVRNPVDVVASLRIGRVMKVPELIGACNYWTEAVSIMNVFGASDRSRVLELRYEDYTREPLAWTGRILDFLGEPRVENMYPYDEIAAASHSEDNVLTAEVVAEVRRICAPWAARYDYLPGRVAEVAVSDQVVGSD